MAMAELISIVILLVFLAYVYGRNWLGGGNRPAKREQPSPHRPKPFTRDVVRNEKTPSILKKQKDEEKVWPTFLTLAIVVIFLSVACPDVGCQPSIERWLRWL